MSTILNSRYSILILDFFFYLVQAERKKRPAPIPFLVRLSHCIGWNPTFLLPLTYYTTTLDSPPFQVLIGPSPFPSHIHAFTHSLTHLPDIVPTRTHRSSLHPTASHHIAGLLAIFTPLLCFFVVIDILGLLGLFDHQVILVRVFCLEAPCESCLFVP